MASDDGGLDDGASGGSGTSSQGTSTAGSGGTDTVDPALPHGFGQDGDGGCACAVEVRAGASMAWLAVLGMLGLAVRRRAR